MDLPVTSPVSSYTLQTNNLSFTLTPRRASPATKLIIKNVSLEARPGEITAIAGPAEPARPRFSRFSPEKSLQEKYPARFWLTETRPNLKGNPNLQRLRAKLLMKDLGLDHISRSRVGSISGGERRRLSIGVELIHDPAALLIDEPTSGLDSASALHIVSLLRSMAVTKHKTVVLTIHQPGFRILELIDRLLLLYGGRALHHGSLESLEERLVSSGHRIPPHINVLEFAIEVASRSGNIDPRIEVAAGHDLDSRDCSNCRKNDSVNTKTATSSYANSHVKEVAVLGERFARNIFRTKELFTARARPSPWGPSSARCAYRVSSYALANALVLLPFLGAVALFYSAPAYWLVGLRRDPGGFLYFGLVAWAVVMMSSSLTACCAALVPDFIMGASLIAEERIPEYWVFMHYLSMFKYPFECLVINEYGGRECVERVVGECVISGDEYLRKQGLKESHKWSNLGVMFGFVVGYRLLYFFILWCRSLKTRRL
ncbi:hypothetical protein SASPL_144384 [Salvia splendens]|uniref:ABC transporter domain-containing protein n=1 Tax=Salvia splendens TaxID=180675 RepID=A0A8X8WEQ7_SALSN|nr:hypothetical protein SASPL_144384 [Salvia splendens]